MHEQHRYGPRHRIDGTRFARDEAPGLTRWVLGAFLLALIVIGVLI